MNVNDIFGAYDKDFTNFIHQAKNARIRRFLRWAESKKLMDGWRYSLAWPVLLPFMLIEHQRYKRQSIEFDRFAARLDAISSEWIIDETDEVEA